jgi:hypothetical protein
MKIYFISLFALFIFWNCDSMTGSSDYSDKAALFVYNTFNYDNFPSFRIGLSSTDNSFVKILLSKKGNLQTEPG